MTDPRVAPSAPPQPPPPAQRKAEGISYVEAVTEAARRIGGMACSDASCISRFGHRHCADCRLTAAALRELARLLTEIEDGTSVTHNTVDLCNRLAAGFSSHSVDVREGR